MVLVGSAGLCNFDPSTTSSALSMLSFVKHGLIHRLCVASVFHLIFFVVLRTAVLICCLDDKLDLVPSFVPCCFLYKAFFVLGIVFS